MEKNSAGAFENRITLENEPNNGEDGECEEPNKGLSKLEYFREYCDNTTIHGIKYIAEKNRTLMERICWLTLFIVSLFYCYHLTVKTYEKWMQSPIIVGFKQKPIPVWEIPFPAVTICPQTKSKQSICNFTALYNDWRNNFPLSYYEEYSLAMLSLLCTKYGPDIKWLYKILEKDLNFLDEVTPKLSDMKAECSWRKDNSIPCSELFKPVFTVEGICYTFNALDHKDLYQEDIVTYKNYGVNNKSINGWNLEQGYTNHQLGINTYPYRDLHLSRKSIELSGLMIDLGIHEDDMDYLCTGADQGFKVFLHHPAEVVGHGQQFFFAPLKQVSEIIVQPEMMVTSEELKSYAPHIRQCYYPQEKPLAYYKHYSKQNCEMECLTNLSQSQINCVTPYMPRKLNWTICGPYCSKHIDMIRDLSAAMKEAFDFNFRFSYLAKLLQEDIKEALKDLTSKNFSNFQETFMQITNIQYATREIQKTSLQSNISYFDDLNETDYELYEQKSEPNESYYKIYEANYEMYKSEVKSDETNYETVDTNSETDETNGTDDKTVISEEKLADLQCGCRPSCTSIKYKAKIFLKDFNWQQHVLATNKRISDYQGMQFARIIVSYADNKILTSERKELFGFEDFIGNCGGLLGLFTGFSFLSAFEVIYYLTLRVWCNIKRTYKKSI